MTAKILWFSDKAMTPDEYKDLASWFTEFQPPYIEVVRKPMPDSGDTMMDLHTIISTAAMESVHNIAGNFNPIVAAHLAKRLGGKNEFLLRMFFPVDATYSLSVTGGAEEVFTQHDHWEVIDPY